MIMISSVFQMEQILIKSTQQSTTQYISHSGNKPALVIFVEFEKLIWYFRMTIYVSVCGKI